LKVSSLLRWRPGGLARAGTELLFWFVLRAAAQVAATLILARHLGATDYGLFVAVLAIAGIFGVFSTLGLPSILLRDGAKATGQIPLLLGGILSIWWRSTLLFSALACTIARVLLPNISASSTTFFSMIAGEIISVSLLELIGRAYQARQQTRHYGAIQAGLPLIRLIAITILLATNQEGFILWLWTYTTATFAYVFAVIGISRNHIGWRRPATLPWWALRQGIPFSAGGLSSRLQTEYNKPLLAQIASAHAGQFNVAQRIVDLASLPLLAIQEALWPRLYADKDHRRRLLTTGTALLLMSLAGGLIIVLGSLVVPNLLGSDYQDSAQLMIWLAGLPLLSVLRNLGNFRLIASNCTHLLTWVYLAGAVASFGFSTWLIPKHALIGAVWACYATEIVSLTCILLLIRTLD
jgi:O-antigen/teichoic acid export membrane protein